MAHATRHVVVIGGGPAGMAAAIAAAAAGARVALCERQDRPGRKLAATGGGRCNLTNTLDPDTCMARFGREGRFMTNALRQFSRDDLLARMREWGVPCAAADGFHYFPVSQKATDVLEALEHRMRVGRVDVRCSGEATEIDVSEGRVRGVRAGGAVLPADAVILASGGAAWPALGGSDRAYTLARQVGHTVTPPVPALVGLTVRDTWVRTCAGVTLPGATVRMAVPRCRVPASRGIVLFTHDGLSGPAILDISGDVAELLGSQSSVPVTLELLPDMPVSAWRTRVDGWRFARGGKKVRNCLDECLPQSLAKALCEAADIPDEMTMSQLSAPAGDRLIGRLAACPVTVTGTDGMARAMVTRGGVVLREVDPATLQSRRVAGLHFAGEVLDLDGPCGGFNLQWAFSSGWLAGTAAAR